MMLKLLLWSLLSGCVSATTMDLKTGDNLTLNCSSYCISNIVETDSGFYRCVYKIADEKSCSMYRVSISDVPPTKTPAPAPIPVIVIAAVTGLIVVIAIIFTLCVIPKVKKRMRSGESEAQMHNIYEVMSRN
uniref:Uncharacterized protein n=1 Tax=Knipowitschia caucasica TaxID=637954 RepID=A0AAV2LN16_KNICA